MPHTEKTASGFDANVAAALSYFLGFVTGAIFLVIEKRNRFVRFHAMQSTIFFAIAVLAQILLRIIPAVGFLLWLFVILPVSAVVWLLMMYKAYQGEEFKLPLIGQWAADRI